MRLPFISTVCACALYAFAASASMPTAGSTLIVLSEEEENAAKSFRNLEGVLVLSAANTGIADIVRPATLVASQAAVDALAARASRQRAPRASSAGAGDRHATEVS